MHTLQSDSTASVSRMKAVLHCNRATCLLQLAAQQQQQQCDQSSKLQDTADNCAATASDVRSDSERSANCSDDTVTAVAAPSQTVPKQDNSATSTITCTADHGAVLNKIDTPAVTLR
jgi:hypothetical protein